MVGVQPVMGLVTVDVSAAHWPCSAFPFTMILPPSSSVPGGVVAVATGWGVLVGVGGMGVGVAVGTEVTPVFDDELPHAANMSRLSNATAESVW